MIKPRDVIIKPVLNGWVVEVGCQTLVFSDGSWMLEKIQEYLDDPDAATEWWLKHATNAKFFRDSIVLEAVAEDTHARMEGVPTAPPGSGELLSSAYV